jgi:hypothetical protein
VTPDETTALLGEALRGVTTELRKLQQFIHDELQQIGAEIRRANREAEPQPEPSLPAEFQLSISHNETPKRKQ